jgi:hypothetical protein
MKLQTTRLLRLAIALAIVCGTCGCSLIQPVAAWEKGTLARPEMSFEGDRLENKFAEHIYTSKEGASGGSGVGGGGCGCN